VHGAVIEYYTEAGMYDAANETFQKIQRPGIAEYCSWVRALGRADQAATANEILRDKMPSRPLDAYNAALDAWLHSTAKNTASAVRRLWKKIKSEGLEPREEDYTLYLEILAKWRRQSTHADSILSEMRDRGIPLDINHYHYTIQACVMSRDWQRCRSLLLRMSKEGIYPTADTYSDHILPFLDVHRAVELLPRMKGKLVSCDLYHSVMINCMRKPTRAAQDKVYGLYQTMLDRGVKPDNETFSILINYFVKRDLPRTLKLLQDLEDYDDINADYSHYNPIMEVYIRNQQPLKAAEILLRRVDAYLRQDNHDDIMPLPDNIHDVFIALIRADELPAASWLLGRLHYMPLVTFELTYKMMMDAWEMSDEPDKKTRIGRIKALLRDVEVRKSDESMRPKKMTKEDALIKAFERFDFDSLLGKPPGEESRREGARDDEADE
jgi:pentatricopeptide repeat protein